MEPDENNIILPNYQRNFRNDESLTQSDVAFLLDIKNAGRISEWENGSSNPSLEHSITLGLIYHRQIEAIYYPLRKKLLKKLEVRMKLLQEKKQRQQARKGIG